MHQSPDSDCTGAAHEAVDEDQNVLERDLVLVRRLGCKVATCP